MTIGSQVVGCGPLRILVLHGWLSDQGVYSAITPLFDQTRYTVALMDFRGYGRSRHLNGKHSIDEIADDALALANSLGWHDFHVVGHSMGGMVIQKLALKTPARILSGVAVTPVAASGFAMDDVTRTFFQSAADDDTALLEIFNTLTGKRHAQAVLAALVRAARASTTREAFLGYLEAWTNTNFEADVTSIRTPILVIAGAHDLALGPQAVENTYLKQLSHVQMRVIEAAGHYPMIETPAEFFTLLDNFFTSHSST